MNKAFDFANFESIQTMLFPLVKALGGPDIAADYMLPAGEEIHDAAVAFHEIGEFLDAVGNALKSGHISQEDIDLIIAEAADIETAVARIGDLDNDAE